MKLTDMRALGVLILGACAALLISGYSREKRRRLFEYNEIVKLLSHIRRGVNESAKSLIELLSDFPSDLLSESELAKKLKENRNGWRSEAKDIYSYIDKEDKERFFSYLYEFGKGSIDEELVRTEDTLTFFKERERCVKTDTEKNIRVAWILFATAFVSIVILIL